MNKKNIIYAISLLFSMMFVYAASSKLLESERFILTLKNNNFLSPFAGVLWWMVPGIELIITAMLFIPKFRLKGFYAATGLMFIFTIYVIVIANFSPTTPCTCGGFLAEMSWNMHIVFNAAFTLLGIVAIVLEKRSNREDNLSTVVYS